VRTASCPVPCLPPGPKSSPCRNAVVVHTVKAEWAHRAFAARSLHADIASCARAEQVRRALPAPLKCKYSRKSALSFLPAPRRSAEQADGALQGKRMIGCGRDFVVEPLTAAGIGACYRTLVGFSSAAIRALFSPRSQGQEEKLRRSFANLQFGRGPRGTAFFRRTGSGVAERDVCVQ